MPAFPNTIETERLILRKLSSESYLYAAVRRCSGASAMLLNSNVAHYHKVPSENNCTTSNSFAAPLAAKQHLLSQPDSA